MSLLGVVLVVDEVMIGDDCPRGPVPLLKQRLSVAVAVVVKVAHGPTLRRRCAGYAPEEVALRRAGVGRGDDCPRGPVPLLDQRLSVGGVVVVVADGPT